VVGLVEGEMIFYGESERPCRVRYVFTTAIGCQTNERERKAKGREEETLTKLEGVMVGESKGIKACKKSLTKGKKTDIR